MVRGLEHTLTQHTITDEDRESQFGKVYSVSGPVVVAENMVSAVDSTLYQPQLTLIPYAQIGAAMYELVRSSPPETAPAMPALARANRLRHSSRSE